MELYEYEAETHYGVLNSKIPRYTVLETVEDRITGTVWHKLKTNEKAARLIIVSKYHKHWDIHTEVDGTRRLWVTEKFLTVLHIQGLQKGNL